jgi:hypothetical protein
MATQTDDPAARADVPDVREPRHLKARRLDATIPVAVGVFVVGTAAAEVVSRRLGISGFGIRGWSVPLGYGFAGCLAILGGFALLRRAPDWLAGASAGFFGSWVALMLSTAIRGTPFPFYGLLGDSGRLTAMATRYSVTWHSADAMIPGLPSEYPPLFPWVIGRTSALIDVPAWRLVGEFEVLTMGLAFLVGFLMWRKLLPAWVALATTAFAFLWFSIAPKAYETIALIVFLPWALATFGRPPRGRLHWLTAGIVGGLIVQTYYGWLLFGGLGILGIAITTLRSERDRRAYLLYLVKVAGTAFVVASWFLGPLIFARLTMGGETVADLYGSSNFLDLLFPFVGNTPIAVLQLIGLVGMIFLRRSSWWATPLLTMVAGAYLYRILGTLAFALTQHTLLAQYTPSVYGAAMTAAGVLTFVDATPKLLERLRVEPPRGGVVIALAVALAWAGYTYTMDWMPNIGGRYSQYTERAYIEPMPDGTYLVNKTSLGHTPWFPVAPVEADVERVLGPHPTGVVLSADERLFSFLPWNGYTWDDLGGSLNHTFGRVAEIRKLEATPDPARFATASAHTAYGPIDIFVLSKKDANWQWVSHMGFNQPDAVVNFQPAQFDPAYWVVDDHLPNDYVVAIRKP